MKRTYADLYETIYALLAPEKRDLLKQMEAAALDLEREDRLTLRSEQRATIKALRAEVKRLKENQKALLNACSLQSAALALWLAPWSLGHGPHPVEVSFATDSTMEANRAAVAALRPLRKGKQS